MLGGDRESIQAALGGNRANGIDPLPSQSTATDRSCYAGIRAAPGDHSRLAGRDLETAEIARPMGVFIDDAELKDVGKIGGWLALPGAGIVVTLLQEGAEAWSLMVELIATPNLETLFPVVIAVPWVLFASAVAVFFFRKHQWAPYLYIVLLGAM